MTMPTQIQFNDMIERLEQIYDFYQSTPYHFNEYELYLSNGERLQFNFHVSRMAHLLGINVDGFLRSQILNSTYADKIWEEIIERSIYIYQRCLKGEVNYSNLFSDFMEEKMEYFKNVLQMNFDDIQFVCKYERAIGYLLGGSDRQYGCDYYIAFLNSEQQYYFLGLTYDEKIHRLVPSSILPPSEKKQNEELLYEIIHNQRILLCNTCIKTNINSVRRVPLNAKVEKIAQLIEIANKNGAILDVSQEALYLSKLTQKSISKYNDAEQIVRDLVTSMQDGERMNSGLTLAKNLGEPFEKLIEVCNARVQITGDGSVTELIKELTELRQELISAQGAIQFRDSQIASLQEQLEQKDLTIAEQDEMVQKQDEEIKRLTDFRQDSFQLYKKYFKADE